MSDPAVANPAGPPPPPVSVTEGSPGSLTIASLRNDHVAASSIVSAGSPSSQPPKSPPSLPSSTSKAPASVSGSRTATLTATSPPTTVGAGRIPGPGPGPVPGTGRSNMSSLNPHLPSHNSQLHVAEARAALVASMSNMLDNELQSRASLLHSNASALSRQEQDVARATEALRKENDKLAKVAKDAGRKIKELGNVQNWAEVLERDFLVLEETMRLVKDGNGGKESDEGESCSECSGSSYWSGSESGSEHGGGARADSRRSGSSTGSRRGSVSKEQEQQADGKSMEALGKGKEVDGSVLDNTNSSGTTGDGGSATSSASLSGSASNLSSSTNATVSLDEAILESLAEAMATDMRIDFTSAEQSTTSLPNAP
ncbi:hypothetical protein HD806DRAFT_514876 [Xylariaceae sp. AK1471]|nr:hypothetical protein HD806DRAFT_514876 [Xylariaceae sp. AK1471]